MDKSIVPAGYEAKWLIRFFYGFLGLLILLRLVVNSKAASLFLVLNWPRITFGINLLFWLFVVFILVKTSLLVKRFWITIPAVVFFLSLFFMPVDPANFLLHAFVRLLGVYFYALAGYMAVLGVYALFRTVLGDGVAAYSASFVGSLLAVFFVYVYLFNFFLHDRVGGFVTIGLLRMGFENLAYTFFMLRSFGAFSVVLPILLFILLLASFGFLFVRINARLRAAETPGLPDARQVCYFFVVILLFVLPAVRTEVLRNEPISFFLVAASRDLSPKDGPPEAPLYLPVVHHRKNVVLIVADSVGAEHLPHHGYWRNTMPHLSELLGEDKSLIATDYYSHTSVTTHSINAIFTGKYYCAQQAVGSTLFDIMKYNGYETALFSSSDLSWEGLRSTLFNRNIDTYHDYYDILKSTGARGFAANDIPYNVPYDAINMDMAEGWITQTHPAAPFFVYLDFQSTHAPYYFSENITPKYAPFYQLQGDSLQDMLTQTELVVNRYDNSIVYADVLIHNLISFLKEKGLYNNTIIVFTADHGEAFGEHNSMFHGSTLYNEQLHVPLVILDPSLNESFSVKYAQNVDILPSILYLLGVEDSGNLHGVNLFVKTRNTSYLCLEGAQVKYGLVRDDIKYLRDPVSGTEELYDLSKDPREENNLAYTSKQELFEMEGEYAAFKQKFIEH